MLDLLIRGATVLDVRAADAYAAGHVPGALNVPVSGGSFGTKTGFLLRAAAGNVVAAAAVPAVDAAPTHADDAHAEGDHEEPRYMMIFFWLTIFTLIELGLSPVFHLHGAALAIGLSFFASLKALAVAFYYMHLKFERTAMKILLLLPVALIVVLFVLILPDAVSALRTTKTSAGSLPPRPTAMFR